MRQIFVLVFFGVILQSCNVVYPMEGGSSTSHNDMYTDVRNAMETLESADFYEGEHSTIEKLTVDKKDNEALFYKISDLTTGKLSKVKKIDRHLVSYVKIEGGEEQEAGTVSYLKVKSLGKTKR